MVNQGPWFGLEWSAPFPVWARRNSVTISDMALCLMLVSWMYLSVSLLNDRDRNRSLVGSGAINVVLLVCL